MESFIEYMIAQKRTPSVIIKKALIYFAAFFVGLIVSVIMIMIPFNLVSIIPITLFFIFYSAYRINTSFNVEFEYILTNGELDVDKITHKRKRKRIITVHCKSFIEFGKIEPGNETDNNSYSQIIDASAKSKTFEDYYAVFYKNGQKVKLIFNPTGKMTEMFKFYAPRVVK